MTDITPNSDLPPSASDNPGQNENNHLHPSRRHHHHSHGHRHGSERRFRCSGSRSDHSKGQSGNSNLRKTEAFLSKQFLKIAGILFILGSIWLIIGKYKPLKKIAGPVITTDIIEKVTKITPPVHLTNTTLVPIIISILFIVIVLLLSWRRKSVELELISLCAWILTGLWWILKYIELRNTFLLYAFIVAGSLIYLSFFLSNIVVRSYHDGPRVKNILESILIIANSAFYYASIVFLLYFSGLKNYEAVFTALLLVINIIIFYIAGNNNISYNKIPYLLFTGIIISMLLPWILRMDYLILFLAVFSIYLMVFSKYSGHQISIILSLVAMTSMILIYLSGWIFEFLPSLFTENLLPDKHLFYKGLIAGFFVLFSVSINAKILEKLHISLSKKWFTRGTYRKIFKGVLLFAVYLFSYWALNYIISWLIPKQLMKPLIWCSFNCIYFICTILILANQRSSFLPISFILAIILSLFYPILIHRYNINIRDTYLEVDRSFLSAFLFHYVVAGLMIILLLALLRYVNRSFGGKKVFIKAYWVYFSLFILFLLFSEFNHIVVLLSYVRGVKITEIITRYQEILISLLLMICAIIILFMGFIRKTRFLRIYSLIILIGIIAKIIIIDIPTLGPMTKTVVFLFLGAMLLLISFFYSRVKHIFLSKHTSHSIKRFPGSTPTITNDDSEK